MNDQEIIQQYRTQEENKERIRKYYQALNNKDWNTIKQHIDQRAPEINSTESRKLATQIMGFDDPEWISIRSDEFKVYEKFTKHYQTVEQLHEVNLTRPSTLRDDLEREYNKKEHLNQIKTRSGNRHYKIVQIIAEGDIVMCRLIITDKDPKSGLTIKFPSNEYYLFKNGGVAMGTLVDHLLSPLIQLGKIIAESEDESAKEYLQSLKILGFID